MSTKQSHQSYCASQGRTPFNWTRFLQRKRYTVADMTAARKLSGEWVTCACGNQCEVIPRNDRNDFCVERGEPLDALLAALGSDFHRAMWGITDAVETGMSIVKPQRRALKVLRDIEKRSATLIRAILKQQDA